MSVGFRPAVEPALGNEGCYRCLLTGHRRGPTVEPNIEPREMTMKWKTPVIIEIAVGLEINAYACAEVK